MTVCANAAGEVCPIWPGHPFKAHWGIEDPAAIDGTPAERLAAFATTFHQLRQRIALFTALPIATLEAEELAKKLRAIGQA